MMRRCMALAAIMLAAGIASAQGFAAQDVNGRAVSLVISGQTRAVVLFFIASDCPYSNRSVPEMKRVEAEFKARGVAFWFVYPNATQTVESIHEHLAAFGVGDVALVDPHERLARLTGAKWTPEAVVLMVEKGRLRPVYVGRIDDRYLGIGKERPQATQHDLEDAVGAVVAGRTPKKPGGPSVGCGIVGAP